MEYSELKDQIIKLLENEQEDMENLFDIEYLIQDYVNEKDEEDE